MPNLAALRAAIFLLSAKNRWGGHICAPPPAVRGLTRHFWNTIQGPEKKINFTRQASKAENLVFSIGRRPLLPVPGSPELSTFGFANSVSETGFEREVAIK